MSAIAALRQAIPPSGWTLIAANLVPLAGVALFGWRAADVVMLYWFENLVIGLFNLPRILLAGRGGSKAFLAIFFAVHYFGFCYGHGSALAAILGDGNLEKMAWEVARQPGSAIAIAGFVVSHAYSFGHNYIVLGEYRNAAADDLMMRPYHRVFLVHVFVIAGGAVLHATGSPAAALAIFVLVKTGIDLRMHRREHQPSSSG